MAKQGMKRPERTHTTLAMTQPPFRKFRGKLSTAKRTPTRLSPAPSLQTKKFFIPLPFLKNTRLKKRSPIFILSSTTTLQETISKMIFLPLTYRIYKQRIVPFRLDAPEYFS